MIEFHAIEKSYRGQAVLGPITGTIMEGGVTALIGPNGAGKSTLLTIIGRLLTPDGGTVRVGDRDVFTERSAEIARILSILRQENHFTTRMTVRELVGFGRFPHSAGRLTANDHEQIARALEFLDLSALSERFLDELSGGQRQRAYVAMVLAQDTQYVLLDEPLNNLDIRHAVSMMGMLRRAADELGKTIVIVIHDINFAAAYADHILALRGGQIAAEGSPEEIMRAEVLEAVFDTPMEVIDVGGRRIAHYYRTAPVGVEA